MGLGDGTYGFGERWDVVMCEGSLEQLPVWAWEMGMVAPFNKNRNKGGVGWERKSVGKVS